MHYPEADRLTVRERTVVWDELSGEFTACPAENNFGSSLSERESGCGGDLSGELTVRERAVVGANGLGSSLSDRGWLWGRTISRAHCSRESGCGGELSGELTVRERAVVGTNNLGSSLSERERLWGRTVRGAYCPRESGCGGELSGELTATPRENGCRGEQSEELTATPRENGKTGKGRTIWEQTVVGSNRPGINVQ